MPVEGYLYFSGESFNIGSLLVAYLLLPSQNRIAAVSVKAGMISHKGHSQSCRHAGKSPGRYAFGASPYIISAGAVIVSHGVFRRAAETVAVIYICADGVGIVAVGSDIYPYYSSGYIGAFYGAAAVAV